MILCHRGADIKGVKKKTKNKINFGRIIYKSSGNAFKGGLKAHKWLKNTISIAQKEKYTDSCRQFEIESTFVSQIGICHEVGGVEAQNL